MPSWILLIVPAIVFGGMALIGLALLYEAITTDEARRRLHRLLGRSN